MVNQSTGESSQSFLPWANVCDSPVRVETCRYFWNLLVVLRFVCSCKPMLLPLKQHSFKKLSKSNVNYETTFDLCLTNFPSPRIFGLLPSFQRTRVLFWKSNNSIKRQNNGHWTSIMGLEWADLLKKSRETVPLKSVCKWLRTYLPHSPKTWVCWRGEQSVWLELRT